VVEVVSSTGFKQTKEKLKTTFAYFGIPRRVTSDSPKEEGFVHHRVTPNHPRANGQVERFMQTLNKTDQIAHLQGKSGPDRNMAIQDMLMAYRDTPHPSTGITHYEAMMKRPVRNKLDYTVPRKERSSRDKMMDDKDRQYKEKMTDDGGRSKEHNVVVGDHVLLRLLMSVGDLKDQPSYHKDVEQENLPELPEQ